MRKTTKKAIPSIAGYYCPLCHSKLESIIDLKICRECNYRFNDPQTLGHAFSQKVHPIYFDGTLYEAPCDICGEENIYDISGLATTSHECINGERV